MDTVINIDRNIILFMNETIPKYPVIQKFFQYITHLADSGYIWILIGIILIILKQYRKNGVLMLISLAIGSILGNGILKNVIERDRPFVELHLEPFVSAHGYSCPSGHSMASFVGATCIFFVNKKLGVLAYILASLIAISRVVLLVHYPTDVLLGSILGILVSFLCLFIFKKFQQYCNK